MGQCDHNPKMAHAHRWIIREANALGYFPTKADAKKISSLLARRSIERGGSGVSPAVVADSIRDYFERGARMEDELPPLPEGVADAAPTSRGVSWFMTLPPLPRSEEACIIAAANELGHFPSKRDATQIARLAHEYGRKGLTDDQWDALYAWAIKEHLGRPAHKQEA